MLSEKRVIHMTRMELRRKRESEAYEVWLNTDRRDYISLHRVIGFVAGTLFYAVVAAAVGVTMVYVAVTNLSRSLLIGFLLGAVIGYIVFMFFYQKWYYNYCSKRYVQAKNRAIAWRRDWDTLARIYEEEERAARPTVDMDVLFPEGSLGENE